MDLGEHRLKDFDEPISIFQLGPQESFPPLKTISNTNLPRPASSFVGREKEVAEIVSLLRDGARLLTLTGPGGSGKTRLSIGAATELVPEFEAGVFWVGLAPLRDPALVVATIGQTLGAKDGVASHIGEREMLLVLDNLEQVVEAARVRGKDGDRRPAPLLFRGSIRDRRQPSLGCEDERTDAQRDPRCGSTKPHSPRHGSKAGR